MNEFLKFFEIGLQVFEFNEKPQDFIILFTLLFARFFAFVQIFSLLGGHFVSNKVKIGIATSFVLIIFPTVSQEVLNNNHLATLGSIGFMALLAKEICVGLTLGFVASLLFETVVLAGRLIDLQRDFKTSEIFFPENGDQVSPIANFKLYLAIIIFLTIGAHRFFISSLVTSFEFIPLTKFPEIKEGWIPALEFITVLSAKVISIGFQISLPVILALLLTEILFGLINRLFPEANVFFMSLPVKMFIGVFILLIFLQIFISQFSYFIDDFYGVFKSLIELIGKMVPR
jgi:flagellar biosynthetic protein FliR